jgi:hypothetical protein
MRRTLAIALCAIVAACGDDRARPETTPGFVGSNAPPASPLPGGAVGASASGAGGGLATSAGVGGAGGAGGSEPIPPGLEPVLACADDEVHVDDCSTCQATQKAANCFNAWLLCSDDSYCEQSFFDCVFRCAPGDLTCANACYQASASSQQVISTFVLCACGECAEFCPG